MTKQNRMSCFSANRQGGSLQVTNSRFQRLLRYSVINGKLQLYFFDFQISHHTAVLCQKQLIIGFSVDQKRLLFRLSQHIEADAKICQLLIIPVGFCQQGSPPFLLHLRLCFLIGCDLPALFCLFHPVADGGI